MKTIDWDKCNYPEFIVGNRKKDGSLHVPHDPISPNMRVDAKYKDCDVKLKIIEETKPDAFKASVISISSIGKEKPKDLSENDEVLIAREYICTIHIN